METQAGNGNTPLLDIPKRHTGEKETFFSRKSPNRLDSKSSFPLSTSTSSSCPHVGLVVRKKNAKTSQTAVADLIKQFPSVTFMSYL